MVQVFENAHVFNHDFHTVSLAYLNRYPNPYAKHVLSIDTLERYVDSNGCLRTTKVIVKTGRLPKFIKPFLGTHLDSWIIEKTIINPKTNKMLSYTSNVDHRKFIRVEEYLKYSADSPFSTLVESKVRFSSNLFGFKQKIEEWSRNKFSSNLANSREGLKYVVDKLNERKEVWMRRST
mmetsp:Transcript_3495/g.3402  ORF Transcript_3495/g.3402 Transcript_3495/m.3402 type:complete len:178 (-) Transcript_3495:130-663(-)